MDEEDIGQGPDFSLCPCCGHTAGPFEECQHCGENQADAWGSLHYDYPDPPAPPSGGEE